MQSAQPPEAFRSLLLRYRGRTRLLQRELAERAGVHPRSVQDWETGVNHPNADRLKGLIAALFETGAFSAGHEVAQAEELWAAVDRESVRMRGPFDSRWFAGLLEARATPMRQPAGTPVRGVLAHSTVVHRQDWGQAPDTSGFVGRADELALLRRWIEEEHTRLLAVMGMGGIGKTSLAAKVAQNVTPSFERVYWRSLRNAPPPDEWLAGAIGFLSDQHLVAPPSESDRIAALLQLLRERRCLLVLDNSEALFEPGQREGRYRPGMAGYGRLLQIVAEASHHSCLVLTSREAPPELALLGGAAVRTLHLGGLGVDEIQVLLAPKRLEGTSQRWAELNARFGGNGLALKVVGQTIRELFDGDIGSYLNEARSSAFFGGIRQLLTEQLERCSALEEQVLRVLAVQREPVTLAELLADLGPRVGRAAVLEAVEALRRRSLVERAESPSPASVHPLVGFTLQSVVLEYVTDRLVEQVSGEIAAGRPVLLVNQPLIQAQAKDYVRQTQEHLIGEPILQLLQAEHGSDGTEQRLLALLEGWRARPRAEQAYGPGNVVNLLRLLRGDLGGLNLSRLSIRQAYLQEVEAQDASLAGAHLAEAVLSKAFNDPTCVALSADGAYLVAGMYTGEVYLWRVADRTLQATLLGHHGAVWSVASSGDAHTVASGSLDGTVRLWSAESGHLLSTLQGNGGPIWSMALSRDGGLVATGGQDGTIKLWSAESGNLLAARQGHSSRVRGVALSADGHTLVSGGDDGTVRLWEVASGQQLVTLQGHSGAVWGVAFSADGQLLASASIDGTVKLWEIRSGRPLATVRGHGSGVWGVALSADGQLVAGGSLDGMARVWESSGRLVAILHGHSGGVRGVELSADGRFVASASMDGTLRLWTVPAGHLMATLRGHTGPVIAVALSADGRLVASGSLDRTVRLWTAEGGHLLATLEGHNSAVHGVALSGDGRLVASASFDGTVRLCTVPAGHLMATLEGPSGPPMLGVALSGDGRLLASGGDDLAITVREVASGRVLAALHGHTGAVTAVALSADGRLVASGSVDGTVRLWEAASGRPLATLQGHSNLVWGVALSTDGHQPRWDGPAVGSEQWRVRARAAGRAPLRAAGHHGPDRRDGGAAGGAPRSGCTRRGDGTSITRSS